MLPWIDTAKILSLDIRLPKQKLDNRNHDKLNSQLEAFKVPYKRFIVGCGLLSFNYDYVDNNDLPPPYPNGYHWHAWLQRPNAYNCFKSHQLMMKQALDEGDDDYAVLFLEDDAVFTKDALTILEKAGPPPEFDICYLGSTHHKENVCQDKYIDKPEWVQTDYCHGFYGVVIKNGLAKQIYTNAPLGPYDWMTARKLKNLRAYSLAPPIIVQSLEPSIVETRAVDPNMGEQHRFCRKHNRL